jgi:hypothetical protein
MKQAPQSQHLIIWSCRFGSCSLSIFDSLPQKQGHQVRKGWRCFFRMLPLSNNFKLVVFQASVWPTTDTFTHSQSPLANTTVSLIMWDNPQKAAACYRNLLPRLDIIQGHKLGRQIQIVAVTDFDNSPVLCYRFISQILLSHRFPLFIMLMMYN